MKLQQNWQSTAQKAWSIRLMVLACLVSAISTFLSAVDAKLIGMDPVFFAAASAVFSALAIPARLIVQSSLPTLKQFLSDQSGAVRKKAAGAFVGTALAATAAIQFVGQWEGLRNEAYRDVVGVWTVCYGETQNVSRGDTYSTAECDAMLGARLEEFEQQLDKCLVAQVPVGMKVALLSWAYNVGTGAACRSTLVRKANAGDLRGACNELPRWNRAGGRVIQGLTNRRISERTMCLRSLDQPA